MLSFKVPQCGAFVDCVNYPRSNGIAIIPENLQFQVEHSYSYHLLFRAMVKCLNIGTGSIQFICRLQNRIDIPK